MHYSRPVCFDKAIEGEMERGGGDYVLCVLTRTDMEGVGVITHSQRRTWFKISGDITHGRWCFIRDAFSTDQTTLRKEN
jgi:hypothetical protein